MDVCEHLVAVSGDRTASAWTDSVGDHSPAVEVAFANCII